MNRLFIQMRRNRIKSALFSDRQIEVRDVALIAAEEYRKRADKCIADFSRHLIEFPPIAVTPTTKCRLRASSKRP